MKKLLQILKKRKRHYKPKNSKHTEGEESHKHRKELIEKNQSRVLMRVGLVVVKKSFLLGLHRLEERQQKIK